MIIDLPEHVKTVATMVRIMWPHETVERCGLAIGEESGEIQRAILKREHSRCGDGDRAKEKDWTENLKVEMGQCLNAIMALCDREGFDIEEIMIDGAEALHARMERLGKTWADDPGYVS